MQIRIFAKEPRYRAWAKSRVDHVLGPLRRRVESVEVFLERRVRHGEEETLCRLFLDTRRVGAIVATGGGPNGYVALREALGRARKQLRRRWGRASARAVRGFDDRRRLGRVA